MKILKFNIALAIFSVGFFFNPASAQQDSGIFLIKGAMKSFNSVPKKVYLYFGSILKDSATITNNNYQFKGQVDIPLTATITSVILDQSQSDERIQFILSPGVLDITSEGTLKKALLSGTGAQSDLDFKSALKRTQKIADSLIAIAATDEFKTDLKLRQSVQYTSSNMVKPMTEELIAYLKLHPASPAAALMMNVISSSPFAAPHLVDSLLKTLPKVAQNQLEKAVKVENERKNEELKAKSEAEAKAAIGSKAIDFIQNDVNGNPVHLSSFKGKYVLVDFWASWCAPCRAENPAVVKAYNAYKDKGFTILGVSLDGASSKAAWISAIKADGLTWPQVSDLKGFKNKAAISYGVVAIPQNFLIDPNGVIVAKNLRGEALAEKLAEIIK